MTSQTTYLGTPDDIEAAMLRVITPLIHRIRELELTAGSSKHIYTVNEVAQRTSYSAHSIRRFINEGTVDRKGKRRYLQHKEVTKGDFRITPKALDEFLSHF